MVWTTDGRIILYCDGVVPEQNAPALAATGTISTGSGAPLYIGRRTTDYFYGNIDDVAIYSRAFTFDEMESLLKTGVKKLNGLYNISQELFNSPLIADTTLKAYYRFSSGALTTDSSGEGKTLTAISDPAEDASGKFGGGCAFDGNDAYYVDNDADLAPTGSFSLGGWVKTTTLATRKSIITKGSTVPEYSFGLEILDNNQASFTVWQVGGGNHLAIYGLGKTIVDGTYHFVVGTYNHAAQTSKLYVDAVLVGTDDTPTGTWHTAVNRFEIGGRADGANYFVGSMDDIFFENAKELSATEISNLYNTNIKKYMGVSNV